MLRVVLLFALFGCLLAQPNVTQIIQGYGYPCVDYEALTPDGYYLSLQNIPFGKSGKPGTKGVVFIQHGLTDCAVGVCLNPPPEALPFILADAGYNVWLGNNRGNGYSMTNTKYTPNDSEFWQFTWDDMALKDLPTNINFVLKKTGVSTLSYIGHSEGTIQAFAGFIYNPSLASRVNLFVALAPVCYVYHTGSTLLKVLADFDAADILSLLGDHEFYLPAAIHQFLPDICIIDPQLCDFSLEILMGPSQNINISRISYYLSEEPNPTSVMNMIHWSQGASTNKFQMYDYGPAGNVAHYGQMTPPQYNLNAFPKSLPLALFTGSNDYLADPRDVQQLLSQLSTPPVLVHNEPTYAHVDFIWAPDARVKIYPKILNLLSQYSSTN